MDGHIAVIDMRLDSLQAAIAKLSTQCDTHDVEFQFDRVRRAVDKLMAKDATREILAEARAAGYDGAI